MSRDVFRVLLADDHPVARLGLRTLVAAERGLSVIGEVANGRAALEACLTQNPDVAVLDFWLPELTALQVLDALRAENATTRVLVLSGQGTLEVARQVMLAGARGFLTKDAPPQTVTRAIAEVAAGYSVWSPEQRESFRRIAQRPALSSRELEVLQALASGASNKEIAARLGLADGTVRIHLSNIFAKLDVDDRTAAVTSALRYGLITL
ncbi:MAG: response regulator [Myxococcota bacterium]